MRLSTPRIQPLEQPDWEGEAIEIMQPLVKTGEVHNIFKTLINYPKLYKRWRVFGSHVLGKSSLPAREREIIILRVGWRCQAGYEWGHHLPFAKRAGLTDEEIQRITKGPEAEGWKPFDATLIRAVDELLDDAFITDATWKALSEGFNQHQIMDLVFCVGHYNLVSMALNSFGVQQDEGFEVFPQ